MNALRRLLMRLLEPELTAALNDKYEVGYAIGHAHGELHGRQALAEEISRVHGVDGGNQALGFEQAKRIKARQLH